jgi:hypothetical protein
MARKLSPTDPHEWLRRARSNLARAKSQIPEACLEDLCFDAQQASEIATHQMKRPRGWDSPFPVGRYCRAALVVFFNYGVDIGTVWKSAPFHEPILCRHVTWGHQSPDPEVKERSRRGWLFYRRVKTGKSFYRPMNHVVHA